jgi:hypothetical protein
VESTDSISIEEGDVMRRRVFAHVLMVLMLTVLLSACSISGKRVCLDEVKSSSNCVTFHDGMRWKIIQENFGEPDIAPLPTGESLRENTRVYKDKVIIFHTDLKPIKVNGKTRYEEVVTEIEICEQK